jgi:hypothetical protein
MCREWIPLGDCGPFPGPARRMLKSSFSPGLLKKVQMQGGARWAE